MHEKASGLASADVGHTDYSIVGDIVQVNGTYKSYSKHGDIISSVQLIPAGDNVDPRQPAMIHASGLVSVVDDNHGIFKMSPTQYVHPLRELTDPKPSFPMECHLDRTSNRWKNKRPMPAKGSYVALSGFLMGVKTINLGVDEFQVEVDKLAFLGKSFTPIAAASRMFFCIPSSQSYSSPTLEFTASPITPVKRGLKFSFDTPTPAPKKARLTAKAAAQAVGSSSRNTLEADDELEYVESPKLSEPNQSSQGGGSDA